MHSSNTPVVSATVVVSSIAHKVLSSEGQAGERHDGGWCGQSYWRQEMFVAVEAVEQPLGEALWGAAAATQRGKMQI